MNADTRRRDNARGCFVVLVGPDGVGKTETARAIEVIHGGSTGYFHFYPPWRRPLPAKPPDVNIPNPDKGSNGGSAVLAVLRLARNFVRFWIGYVVRVRPALNRGTLVLGDRWAYGYLVQPGALRYHGPAGLVALAVRALPQPDLVANLAAPGDVILDRKQELTAEEIATELAAWRNLPAKRVITFDTTVPPVEVAAEILRFLST